MPKRTGRQITSDYFKEKVNYGGEIVTRGAMIRDLQNTAKTCYPKDKRKQAGLVNAYLSGHSR